MKKTAFLLILLVATTELFAQFIEITPVTGYTFNGKVDNGYGVYDVNNAMLYGARLDVEVADLSYFELSVRRNDPSVDYTTSARIPINFNTGTAHYMVGFLREFKAGKVIPFGNISLGTSRYWLKENAEIDENYRQWFFSTEFGVGAKYFFNDFLGVRLQASVTTPWDFAGGGMYWGIGTGGGGGSASMTFGIPIAHWDLSAGLIIRRKD